MIYNTGTGYIFMNATRQYLIWSFVFLDAVFLLGCTGPIRPAIDGEMKDLLRRPFEAAWSAVKFKPDQQFRVVSQAEVENRAKEPFATEAFKRLLDEHPKLLEYLKEKGRDKVFECVAKEAAHDALNNTEFSEQRKAVAFLIESALDYERTSGAPMVADHYKHRRIGHTRQSVIIAPPRYRRGVWGYSAHVDTVLLNPRN
jgi:hypothetical protein